MEKVLQYSTLDILNHLRPQSEYFEASCLNVGFTGTYLAGGL